MLLMADLTNYIFVYFISLTLCDICSEHFVECKHPSRVFSLFKGIDNHDSSIFSNVIH